MTLDVRQYSEQEEFWAGEFGSAYSSRNDSSSLLASNLQFFARAMTRVSQIRSCVEFGANIGMNLRALRLLFPESALSAVEINPDAAGALCDLIGQENVYCGSMLDYETIEPVDLAFTKGVLIHLDPALLEKAYRKLFEATERYVLLGEYYNPSPMAIPYRGHEQRLFKRDFAGEMLDMFPDLRLLDYGFHYRRDPLFPQDDITWFLMEKCQ